MHCDEMDEKLRAELLASLDELARQNISFETGAEERSVPQQANGLARCSCGLIMSQGSFAEHLNLTKHEIRPHEKRVEEGLRGLEMSVAELREHNSETRQRSPPRQGKRHRGKKLLKKSKSARD
jgi:hypothetical protein